MLRTTRHNQKITPERKGSMRQRKPTPRVSLRPGALALKFQAQDAHVGC